MFSFFYKSTKRNQHTNIKPDLLDRKILVQANHIASVCNFKLLVHRMEHFLPLLQISRMARSELIKRWHSYTTANQHLINK